MHQRLTLLAVLATLALASFVRADDAASTLEPNRPYRSLRRGMEDNDAADPLENEFEEQNAAPPQSRSDGAFHDSGAPSEHHRKRIRHGFRGSPDTDEDAKSGDERPLFDNDAPPARNIPGDDSRGDRIGEVDDQDSRRIPGPSGSPDSQDENKDPQARRPVDFPASRPEDEDREGSHAALQAVLSDDTEPKRREPGEPSDASPLRGDDPPRAGDDGPRGGRAGDEEPARDGGYRGRDGPRGGDEEPAGRGDGPPRFDRGGDEPPRFRGGDEPPRFGRGGDDEPPRSGRGGDDEPPRFGRGGDEEPPRSGRGGDEPPRFGRSGDGEPPRFGRGGDGPRGGEERPAGRGDGPPRFGAPRPGDYGPPDLISGVAGGDGPAGDGDGPAGRGAADGGRAGGGGEGGGEEASAPPLEDMLRDVSEVALEISLLPDDRQRKLAELIKELWEETAAFRK